MAMIFAPLMNPAPAKAAEKLTVLLDWFVNPDHAALIIAKERGMFEAAGLDVDLVPPADPSAPPRLVAAGQADLAISYQPQLHVQVGEGLPLVRIGTLAETPLNSLVVLQKSGIKTIADLKGKTVGFSVGGFEDAVLGAMLKTAGLQLSDVNLVNINFALSPSLITGKVDAVIGAFRNFELNQLDIENEPGLAFFPEEHGVPVYDELILVARNDRVDDPRFRTFLDVIESATLYLTNHPEEAWDQFATAHPDLNNDLNQRAWHDTLPRLAKRPGALDTRRYERFAAFMKESGLIRDIPPLGTYAVEVK
jgi:putative hydroxymethylpyrimidine transport system substrate-binding protein